MCPDSGQLRITASGATQFGLASTAIEPGLIRLQQREVAQHVCQLFVGFGHLLKHLDQTRKPRGGSRALGWRLAAYGGRVCLAL